MTLLATAPMIDLRPRDAIVLKAIFRTYAPLAEVWAYGSRVSGKGHAASDLDLAVRNTTALDVPATNLATLRSAIEDSSLPLLVDLHDWALLPETFRRHISNSHSVAPGQCHAPLRSLDEERAAIARSITSEHFS